MSEQHPRLWISRVLERVQGWTGAGYLLSNVLTVGGVPLVLTFVYFAVVPSPPDTLYRITHSLFAVMLSGIGYLVWYYDTHLLPEFFENVGELLEEDRAALDDIVDRSRTFFAREYWKTLLLWVPLAPIAFFGNLQYFQSQGMGGPETLSYYVLLAFGIYAALLTGIGIHLILTTLLCVGRISRAELAIDPYHPDGLGGMSAVGSLSVWTMGLASIGSLGMPFAFQLAAGGQFGAVVYAAFAVYLALLVGIFVYPVVQASKRAETNRGAKLAELRAEIQTVESELEDAEGRSETAVQNLELRHQRLRDEYDTYSSIPLYPLSIGVLLRFAGSVLLPIVLVVLEYYVSSALG